MGLLVGWGISQCHWEKWMCAHTVHFLPWGWNHGLHIQITSYVYIAVSDPKHSLFHLLCLPMSALQIISSCLLNNTNQHTHLLGGLCHIKPDILWECFRLQPRCADSMEKGDGTVFSVAVHWGTDASFSVTSLCQVLQQTDCFTVGSSRTCGNMVCVICQLIFEHGWSPHSHCMGAAHSKGASPSPRSCKKGWQLRGSRHTEDTQGLVQGVAIPQDHTRSSLHVSLPFLHAK